MPSPPPLPLLAPLLPQCGLTTSPFSPTPRPVNRSWAAWLQMLRCLGLAAALPLPLPLPPRCAPFAPTFAVHWGPAPPPLPVLKRAPCWTLRHASVPLSQGAGWWRLCGCGLPRRPRGRRGVAGSLSRCALRLKRCCPRLHPPRRFHSLGVAVRRARLPLPLLQPRKQQRAPYYLTSRQKRWGSQKAALGQPVALSLPPRPPLPQGRPRGVRSTAPRLPSPPSATCALHLTRLRRRLP